MTPERRKDLETCIKAGVISELAKSLKKKMPPAQYKRFVLDARQVITELKERPTK
jgi:hypothetical protein